ncbi:hypothetical protein GCM10023100_48510 [Actinocorallia cavernae]|uniref:Uncharacterized protein n=2 Tax=Actinomycetes TaxID=1760 RepID=A0ABN3MFF3_9ACTN
MEREPEITGRPEAARCGYPLAATANPVWTEPLFSRTFEGPGRTPSRSQIRDTVADAIHRETNAGSPA